MSLGTSKLTGYNRVQIYWGWARFSSEIIKWKDFRMTTTIE